MKTFLKELAEQIDVKLSDKMVEQFFIYKDLLKEWNEKINLTAIVDDEEIIIKHFIDSLTIVKHIPQNAKIIDVGTGAGFPGIPIKIARPDVEVVLLDSLNKRINFLNEVIEKTGITDIETIHSRAEDAGNNIKYREKFDISTARAVANMSTLLEYCTPFLKEGGRFICMKAEAREEVKEAEKAIKTLNMQLEDVEEFKLPKIEANRTVIILKKLKSTPPKYPRKAGIPSKEPIK